MVVVDDFAYPTAQAPSSPGSNLGTKHPQEGDTIESNRCHEVINIESMKWRGLALVVWLVACPETRYSPPKFGVVIDGTTYMELNSIEARDILEMTKVIWAYELV